MTNEIRNARYNHLGTINIDYNHPEFGWIPYTADPNDIVELGRELYAQALLGAVAAYIPPTAEEARASMLPISRRQLRLALVRNGISLASIDAAIASMPDGQDKEEAEIEWADAASFERLHPTLALIGAALGLTDAQIDAMWVQASAI